MNRSLPGSIHVFTYREGLLSRLGHDLRLSFERFSLQCRAGQVSARVELGSICVDGTMRDGRLDPQQLDANDREKIVASATQDVLAVARFPEANFAGKALGVERGRGRISGTLTLHGSQQPFEALVELTGRELVVSATITPSRHAIAPFRTLAGAIKVQDRVRIEVRATLPEAHSLDELLQDALTLSPAAR